MYICATPLLLDWQFPAFIGARKVSGIWRWHGRLTEPMTYEWWGDSHPTGGDRYCINFGPLVKYKFNDINCGASKYFLCERERNS